jgi:hypothetical protein
MKYLISVVACIVLTVIVYYCYVVLARKKNDVKWPPLSKYGYTAGRSATSKDVNDGRAVFVLLNNKMPIGRPIEITIPQYAFHLNHETNQRIPCVIIQAEEASGQKLIGCRVVSNNEIMAGLASEFEFIGINAAQQGDAPEPASPAR